MYRITKDYYLSLIPVYEVSEELFDLEQALCPPVGLSFLLCTLRRLDSQCWQGLPRVGGQVWVSRVGLRQHLCCPQGGTTHKRIHSPDAAHQRLCCPESEGPGSPSPEPPCVQVH